MKHAGFIPALAVFFAAAMMTGCDTDYDATANMETDENEQVTTDQGNTDAAEEPSSLANQHSYSEEARNPGVNYGDPNYSSIYDNDHPAQTGDANAEETVYFPPDLATLNNDEQSDLKQFAEYLRQQDLSNMQITIASYAASNSTPEYDKQLSELRAETVRDFLQSEGIDVANWDLQTLANGKLAESDPGEMGDNSPVAGQPAPDIPSAEQDADMDSNKVIVSLVPYNQEEEVSAID